MQISITFLICFVGVVSGFQFNRQCRTNTNFRLNDARLAVDLESLSRPELQALAKAFNIKANGKSSDLVQQLGAIKSGGSLPSPSKPTKKVAEVQSSTPTPPAVPKPTKPMASKSQPAPLVPEEKVSRLQERALAKKKLVAASQTESSSKTAMPTKQEQAKSQLDATQARELVLQQQVPLYTPLQDTLLMHILTPFLNTPSHYTYATSENNSSNVHQKKSKRLNDINRCRKRRLTSV